MNTTKNPADQTQSDDHDGFGKPSAESLRLKYEPDGYDQTSVISVPVLVIVFFVIAFAATTVLYNYFTRPKVDPFANPMAVQRNSESLNDRMKRIDRRAGEIKQPRLEAFRTRSGNSLSISRPEVGDDNPPYVTPEDSRVELARTPELFRTAWVDSEKTFALVPLDRVIGMADKKLFPVVEKKWASGPRKSFQLPSGANAGRGAEDSTVVLPTPPAQSTSANKEEIPPPKKPDEPKKVEEKKNQPQPPPKPPEVNK